MKSRFAGVVLGGWLAVGAGAGVAQQDQNLPLNLVVGGDPSGTVNVLFRDFSNIPDFGDFNWIKNTIEIQVTTNDQTYNDPAPNDCCPVVGHGSLSGSQQLRSLFLNFNPNLDITRLRLFWTGEAMPVPGIPPGAAQFPTAGNKPSEIAIAPNGFYAGGGQLFDVFLRWDQPLVFSKLLLVYDNANTDIGFADVFVQSSTAPYFTSPGFGPLLAAGQVSGTGGAAGSATIAAIPEPSSFVMLAAGLLGLAFAARRRSA